MCLTQAVVTYRSQQAVYVICFCKLVIVGSFLIKMQPHAQTAQSVRLLAHLCCSSNFHEIVYINVLQQLEIREILLLPYSA